MRIPTAVYITVAVAITLDFSVPGAVSAQLPTVAVPERGAVIKAAAPTEAATPQPPGQPTAAPAAEPAPVTAVTGSPSGPTLLPAAAPQATASSSAAATMKSYSAARFSLNLDGINAGFLQAAEGGAAVGTVAVENLGPDNIRKKHVAGVTYEDLSFDVGMDSKPVIDWINETWQGKASKKSGSVQIMDHDYNVVVERQFKSALITGTTVPALEASGKKALALTVTVAPEYAREVAGSGKAPGLSAKGKVWSSSNFRFDMGDLETSFVRRIEPFTVGQKVTENEVGDMRQLEKQPNTLEFPNLKIRMANRPYPKWAKWQEEFLIDGKGGEGQEKNGAIVFLDPSQKIELGRINLFNCGLVRLGGDRLEASSNNVSTLTAELYCEKMDLAINK